MIKSFQLLFKGRRFVEDIQSEQQIRQVIQSELLDELTHPRARQSIEKKYLLAVTRVQQSDLAEVDQLQIISLYDEEYAKLLAR
ncbi:hypothetical protein [Psychrobacillus sp.]|uniref:hypothetical protein n=1 Tax=Psychrobacillus sp. TaxID=1871623 RepID=UPI0028BD3BBC|nr:hypothetical protein [Psychrobacillus sp.]